MTISLPIPSQLIARISQWARPQFASSKYATRWSAAIAALIAVASTAYVFSIHAIIAYGDAESHLNIAKRVVSGLTPGLAQLGGIWLPLPHILMVPFIWFDPLWRSGLAGSIVSGLSFVVSAVVIFHVVHLVTKSFVAAWAGFFVFVTNPNVLYLQATPMTELSLIVFLLLSTYFFMLYLTQGKTYPLILAGAFGLAASLSRYDGWFLVLLEGLLILIFRFPHHFLQNIRQRGLTLFSFLTERGEGEAILFATIALIGILGWFSWGKLILGDPLYFTNSQFSAKSQQQGFLARGELPAYHNLPLAVAYYTVTTMASTGVLVFAVGAIATIVFLLDKKITQRYFFLTLLLSSFFFNIVTLFLGQSIIFIPHITPVDFEWSLFNVRYGVLMVPIFAILFAYLFARVQKFGKVVLMVLLIANLSLYLIGYAKVMTYQDGIVGLSHAGHPDAEFWLAKHYDKGLALLDDYARTLSIIGTGIPMQNVVYVGNHLYWDEALKAPQRRMTWIVMQKDDTVWKSLYDDQRMRTIVYTYFHKVYTSDRILIFKRNE